MQANQSQKQSKTKYVKPQVFSISGAIRPHNPAHCRSLVDLNNLQMTSAQKQNHNTDHFSSVTSNQENKPFNNLKNNVLRTGNTKISTNDYANVSNISKILMNGNNSKPKTPMESNKSGFLAQQNSVSTNKNKTILCQTRKNDLFFQNSTNNKLTKNQARTNSQVNLRQNNGSIPKNSSKNLRQTQLQKQKSEKSLKKANPQPNAQINALGLNQTQNTKQTGQHQVNNITKTDYSLLIKLKQYIQQLKTNENEYIKHIKQLQNETNLLKDQIVLLKDKVQVYQIREKQMIKKIKNQQFQINRYSHLQQDLNHNSNPKNNECHQHQLIIQSLKNVINEQMSKIIQMQSYKIQLQEQQEKQRKNKKGLQQLQFLQKDMYRQRNRENEGDHHYRDQKNNGFKLQNAFVQTNSKADNRFQQVYSFKKRNNLNESSIYIEDQTPNSLELESNRALTNQEGSGKGAGSKGKNSQICIPEPYNQLIKCLKSDSRMRQNSKNNTSKNNIKSNVQEVEVVSIDSSRHHQLDFSRKSQQNLQDSDIISSNENSNNKEYLKFRGHCSEDQILQEVGQYLQNIRKNLRQV